MRAAEAEGGSSPLTLEPYLERDLDYVTVLGPVPWSSGVLSGTPGNKKWILLSCVPDSYKR